MADLPELVFLIYLFILCCFKSILSLFLAGCAQSGAKEAHFPPRRRRKEREGRSKTSILVFGFPSDLLAEWVTRLAPAWTDAFSPRSRTADARSCPPALTDSPQHRSEGTGRQLLVLFLCTGFDKVCSSHSSRMFAGVT